MIVNILPLAVFNTASNFKKVVTIEKPLTDEEYKRIKEEWKKSHTGWSDMFTPPMLWPEDLAVFIACSYCGRKHSQPQGVCDGCGAPL